MAQFRVEVPVAAPVAQVWARLTDWPAHAELAPLTTIRVIGPGNAPGSSFVARTGFGPLAFDDPMEIEEYRPPAATGLADPEGREEGTSAAARFRVRKTGWAVRGWIVAELFSGTGSSGRPTTRLVWTEEIRVPPEPLTRWAAPVIAAVAKAGYGAALRKMARQIEKGSDG
ncbi:SRPBCC family protein [Kineosporia babensis]|uniref:SRPBCC family protein n=1 Tax=Kineosporia babensis TaxID=499548 RepID=A0A9X1NK32_9ACTN|nr:SRPBCC family protein [Kineosporia babensis]MCD5315530.1 SRPBCC family protein [Kineosporia babensis]